MGISLDRVIIRGQIEKGYDYAKFVGKIDEGLAYLHQNKEPFEPTKWATKEYGDVESESRKIDVRIRNKEIYYLVVDEGTPPDKDMKYPLRAKGYVQHVDHEEIKEIPAENMQNLPNYIDMDVGKDLVE